VFLETRRGADLVTQSASESHRASLDDPTSEPVRMCWRPGATEANKEVRLSGRGRPRKDRSIRRGGVLKGTDPQRRFFKALEAVVPEDQSQTAPLVLRRAALEKYPTLPPEPTAQEVARIAGSWRLTDDGTTVGNPVPWATGMMMEILAIWRKFPNLQGGFPVRFVTGHNASVVAPPSPGPQLPEIPKSDDLDELETWEKTSAQLVANIVAEKRAHIASTVAIENREPYPSDEDLLLFAWFQVGGLKLDAAAIRSNLGPRKASDRMDDRLHRSTIYRRANDVANALGIKMRRRHN
jgi:hypothetical protein